MKLDRNDPANKGRGKYAIVLLRGDPTDQELAAIRLLWQSGRLEFSDPGSPGEFFVLRLKDKYSEAALRAYANACNADDLEYSDEIRELADRAGPHHPLCKSPD